MSELIIELFSEEMPPNLQISARDQFKKLLTENLSSLNLKHQTFDIYSTPTRLVSFISGLPNKIKILPTEVKGPKVGVPENVVEKFAQSKDVGTKDLYEKKLEKGTFYFVKTKGKEIDTEDELIKCIPKSLNGISWKKSMRWADYNLSWGRPLRSILTIFNNRHLRFKYGHLETVNFTLLEEDTETNQKTVKNFTEYKKILRKNGIILDHNERTKFISEKIESIYKDKSCQGSINQSLLLEVSNLVDKPRVIIAKFDKSYLKLPSEVIKSTLQTHQRYFTYKLACTS